MLQFTSIAVNTSLVSLLLSSTAIAQERYTIDGVTTEMNGDLGNVLNGSDSITITNLGSVATTTDGTYGLYAEGNNNSLINNGTIKTKYSTPARWELVEYQCPGGLVPISGDAGYECTTLAYHPAQFAHGMYAVGSFNKLTNTDTVATIGDAAYGFYAEGTNNILINSGTITTNGLHAHGLLADGANNTLTNSGTIVSKQGYAVYIDGNDATLNLLAGSVLQGDVYFKDPDTATLNFGAGLNAIVAIDDDIDDGLIDEEMTITAPSDQYVVAGQAVYVFDGSFVGASEQAIGGVTSLMLDTLGQQMSYGSMVPAVTQGVAATQREGWGQVFGTERTADGSVGGSTTAGFMVGADLDDVRGLFLGFARSTQEVDASNELESDNFFAGYYANYTLNGLNVDASLTAGMATNSTERSVANNTVVGGLETAAAKYNSYYLMPAATFSGDIPVARGSLIPSVRVSYAAIRDQAYTETGSAANLDVDNRTSHLFGTRVQLDRGLSGYAIGSGMLLANLRAGFDGQYAKGGDVTATLLGKSFELQASNDETSGRGFAGVDLRHVSGDQSHELYGSLEVGRSSTDVTDVSVNLGAVFRF